MVEKLFYTMGEVAEMFDVNPSLLRHWETKFPMLKPHKNKKGNRMFTPADVENLKLIYHLVKERGMTLEGARRALGRGARTGMARDAELLERLQRIRALLEEVRAELSEEPAPEPAPAPAAVAGTEGSVPPVPRRGAEAGGTADAADKELFAYYEQTLF